MFCYFIIFVMVCMHQLTNIFLINKILMEVKLLNANAPAMDEEGDEGEEEEEGNVEDEGDVLSRFIRKGKM